MGTTEWRRTLIIDGVPHMFDEQPRVWADTHLWTHEDCDGVDYLLIQVDNVWTWSALLRADPISDRYVLTGSATSAVEAFTQARTEVREDIARRARVEALTHTA